MVFYVLAAFEFGGYKTMVMSWGRIVCGYTTTSADRGDNWRTMTRDVLHNLVNPRSAPRSRMRCVAVGTSWTRDMIHVHGKFPRLLSPGGSYRVQPYHCSRPKHKMPPDHEKNNHCQVARLVVLHTFNDFGQFVI